MEVSISSRHLEITPRLEEAVHSKIGRLDHYLDQLDTAVVHFEEATNRRTSDRDSCEVTLSGGGHTLRCQVNAPDPFTAVDLAEAKLERQIRKLRTRLQKRNKGDRASIRTRRARQGRGSGGGTG